MKNVLRTLSCLLLLTISFFSCSPDYDSYDVATTKDLLTRANWSVQLVSVSAGVAHDYTGYTLAFDQKGLAVLRKNDQQSFGSWTENNDHVLLNMPTNDVLIQELNREWKVAAKNTNSIAFEATSSSPGYQLVLTKQ